MTEIESRQQILDEEHLRLLSLGYWVSAGATAFLSLFGIFYMGMGMFFEATARRFPTDTGTPPPRGFGLIFGAVGLAIFLVLIVVAALKIYAALSLKKKQARTPCLIVAAITCLGIPYGTVLGIFTFMVLTRPSVVQLYSPPAQH